MNKTVGVGENLIEDSDSVGPFQLKPTYTTKKISFFTFFYNLIFIKKLK